MKRKLPVRLSHHPEQARLLRAHCQEYISASNVLVQALDRDVLPNARRDTSTKDFIAALPSAVKHQALPDARSVWNRSFALGVIPVLRKPICQWNNQNWRMEGTTLLVPLVRDGNVQQIALRCAEVPLDGTPGVLRITRKRGKWIADIALTLPEPAPTTGEAIMGVDLGIKVPAVVHIIGKGSRFLGNGRSQRFKRRQFYGQRRSRQQAGKGHTVKQRQGKERRWMRDTNHQRSRQIVTHPHQQREGVTRRRRRSAIAH